MIRRLRTSVMVRLTTILAVLMMGGVVLAGPASADCTGDWWGKPQVPAPQAPTSGVSGFIDPGFGPGLDLNPQALGSTPDFGPHVNQFFVRPPAYSQYDKGCTPNPAEMVGLDTRLGNWLTGGASVLVSVADALHRQVSPPDLHFMDSLVSTGARAVRDAIFTPWAGVSLLLLCAWMLWRARKGQLHTLAEAGAWAILIIGISAALVSQSVKAASYFDDMASGTVGGIYQVMAPASAGDPFDPGAPRAGAVTDVVLYQNWLRGMVGDPNGKIAQTYGAQLLDATAYSQAEWKQISDDPSKEHDIDKHKGDAFTAVAKKIQDENPHAYRILQGKADDRAAAGLVALISALCVTPFLIVSDLLLLAALLLVRVVVVLTPAVAVVAIHPRFRHHLTSMAGAVGAGLFNAVIFACASAFDMLAISALVGPSATIPRWLGLVLSLALSMVLWKLLKPHRRLLDMASPGRGSDPIHGTSDAVKEKARRVRKQAEDAAAAAAGTAAGGPTGGAAATAALEQRRPPTQQARPEGWARPAPKVPAQAGVVHAGTSAARAPRELPAAEVKPEPQPAFTPYRRPLALPAGHVERHDGDLTVADGVVAHRVYDPETKSYQLAEA
jgi:hypothetical protein